MTTYVTTTTTYNNPSDSAYDPDYYDASYLPPGYTRPGFTQPTAPPMPPPSYEVATGHAQQQLGHDMIDSVVAHQTEWVVYALVPPDTTANRIISWISGSGALPNVAPQTPQQLATFYLEAAQRFYAYRINDKEEIQRSDKLMSTNTIFNNFISNLRIDESNVEHCVNAARESNPHLPEVHFLSGKLNFIKNNFAEAVADFERAGELSKNLTNSSSTRKKRFEAMVKTCAAATHERWGWHDRALKAYQEASKIDPRGPDWYFEAIDRNFLILRAKPNKSIEELELCRKVDPNDPDLSLELAEFRIDDDLNAAVKLLNKSTELAFNYKPSAMFRCAEFARRLAYIVNNMPVPLQY